MDPIIPSSAASERQQPHSQDEHQSSAYYHIAQTVIAFPRQSLPLEHGKGRQGLQAFWKRDDGFVAVGGTDRASKAPGAQKSPKSSSSKQDGVVHGRWGAPGLG